MHSKPAFVCLLVLAPLHAAEVAISAPTGSPRIDFGLVRLEQSLAKNGDNLVRRPPERAAIVLARNAALGAEGFRTVRGDKRQLVLESGGDTGAMYGLLDLAEQLRIRPSLDKVPQRTERPRFAFRAIKFNLPWMSYRKAEALQLHLETCRDLRFWRSFLDMMAENRFNTLTLWNLHPFPFLIRARNFPDATPFSDKELSEWRIFWHELFRMARERGIDTYLVNWNIFVSPEFARARNAARYSEEWSYIGDAGNSPLVERYTRESVTQLLDEYPELTGLGITLGERMGGMTPAQRRDWIERTVIAGMKASKRPARLIYRAPLSAGTGSGGSTSAETELLTRQSIERSALPEPVWVEFKFNWSHAHSATRLYIVHGGGVAGGYWNPPPKNYRVVWTMRNEDFFVLRWAEPDFIREAIANNGDDWVGGYMIGSECYIPAKDYIHSDSPHKTWTYAFERQWLFYSLWGRLLYDPSTTNEVFERQLSDRYGEGTGGKLLRAWTLASRTPLRIASFYRGSTDGTLYSEGFAMQKSGKLALIDIETLINHPVLDPRLVSIADFVKSGARPGQISPLDLAGESEHDAQEAMRIVAELRGGTVSQVLDCELADIEAWSSMAGYFGEKLRGGVALARFRASGAQRDRNTAVKALVRALRHWEHLAGTIHAHDAAAIPQVFDPAFSWTGLLDAVRHDLAIAASAVP